MKCWQCGPAFLICATCDIDIHTAHVLHDRQIWNGSFFQPVPPADLYSEDTNEIFSSGMYRTKGINLYFIMLMAIMHCYSMCFQNVPFL